VKNEDMVTGEGGNLAKKAGEWRRSSERRQRMWRDHQISKRVAMKIMAKRYGSSNEKRNQAVTWYEKGKSA